MREKNKREKERKIDNKGVGRRKLLTENKERIYIKKEVS